jgi:hypothetical protein
MRVKARDKRGSRDLRTEPRKENRETRVSMRWGHGLVICPKCATSPSQCQSNFCDPTSGWLPFQRGVNCRRRPTPRVVLIAISVLDSSFLDGNADDHCWLLVYHRFEIVNRPGARHVPGDYAFDSPRNRFLSRDMAHLSDVALHRHGRGRI